MTKKAELTVEGMSCQHCVARVKNALSSVSGVLNVDVSLEDKRAVVEYDPGTTDPEQMRKAIADLDLGYSVTGYKEV
jgi:copper ion binding protein